MDTTFGTAHMSTLTKLKELAEKHNCVIAFGFDSNATDDFRLDEVVEYVDDLTESIAEELEDELISHRRLKSESKIWFELYDKTKKTYNVLSYSEIEGFVSFNTDDYYSLSSEAESFLTNNEYDGFISFRSDPQCITGFEGVDTSEINVYRSGMALKFFGDLVCDYLGEERIVECY